MPSLFLFPFIASLQVSLTNVSLIPHIQNRGHMPSHDDFGYYYFIMPKAGTGFGAIYKKGCSKGWVKPKVVTIESQIGRGIKRIQQEVRPRSKARRNQSLHFKQEGLRPRGSWRDSLKIGDGEIEIKEQRSTCSSGEARQFEIYVYESLAPSGMFFCDTWFI